MANASTDPSVYYVPPSSWYPIGVAIGAALLVAGLAVWLNDIKAGDDPSRLMVWLGALVLAFVLFAWFAKVIEEGQAGLNNAQLKRSYVWGMSWFIFSEVMFFAAFFGALFYTRVLAVSWLGGEGEKGMTGIYLWPEFEATWPVMQNPDPGRFPGPEQSMAAPSIGNWLTYLPFWNTVILLTSSVTVHFAHTAIKNADRKKLMTWLGVTVLLAIVFLGLQIEEYVQAYRDMGLTLASGIYGSTFFLLTGFHGFHVALGTFILGVQLFRAYKGHFTAEECFGFEAASWYWHFVDVVWVILFLVVYIL
ncbi:MAG: cytochrome c oxidase subunit 3 [Pseudomonadales bacterium]